MQGTLGLSRRPVASLRDSGPVLKTPQPFNSKEYKD